MESTDSSDYGRTSSAKVSENPRNIGSVILKWGDISRIKTPALRLLEILAGEYFPERKPLRGE